MIRTNRQYLDDILWDTAMGVTRPAIRASWPSLRGLSSKDPRYKERQHELDKLREKEFRQEWSALKEFLRT